MIRRFARLLVLAALLASPARAAGGEVLVVLTRPEGAYVQVVDGMRGALARRGNGSPALTVTALEDSQWRELVESTPKRFALIVTVGAQAAREVAAAVPGAPTLHTLVPRLTYNEIVRDGNSRRSSAIFIDQPLTRQLDLVRVALPERRRLAAVLGPTARAQQAELAAAARERGFKLDIERIDTADELLRALNRTLEDNEVLLSVADPLVFNSGTIHHLLLTSYRYRVPVVGLSRAYVDAGALVAVYTSPEQIGQQAAELLPVGGARAELPPPQYPKYYSIEVNERVAASLGLRLEPEAEILRRLQGASGAQP